MTLSVAAWVIQQEYLWVQRNFSSTQENSPFQLAAVPFYIASGVPVAATPYASLVVAWDSATLLADDAWYIRLHRQAGYKIGRRRAAKVLVGKIGSRFIPYVGWALLMLDAWNLGKWIGEKTS